MFTPTLPKSYRNRHPVCPDLGSRTRLAATASALRLSGPGSRSGTALAARRILTGPASEYILLLGGFDRASRPIVPDPPVYSARATASLRHFLPCGQTVPSLSPALRSSPKPLPPTGSGTQRHASSPGSSTSRVVFADHLSAEGRVPPGAIITERIEGRRAGLAWSAKTTRIVEPPAGQETRRLHHAK